MVFDATNDLERSLAKAADDPAHRPQFYRDFLGAEVFVVEHGPSRRPSGSRTLSVGEPVSFMTLDREGQAAIPIFTSLSCLQKSISEEAAYLRMQARDFLELTRGSMLILNPGSDFGKEFLPEEVESLLNDSIWRPTETYVAQKATRVQIGQPGNYPTELVDVLIRTFKPLEQVRRAYLAHFFNPERDEKPHTLIAIEVTSNWDHVASNAGLVARSVSIPDPPVDFMQMTGKAGIEDHFRQNVKPFYEAKAHQPWWRFW